MPVNRKMDSFVYLLLGLPAILRTSNLKIHNMHGKFYIAVPTFYYHSLHHVQNHHYSSGLRNSSDACKYYPTKKGNISQLTFTCLRSTIETLEKDVKYI